MLQDKRLQKNILAMYFVQFANMIVPLMTTPYLARVLGLQSFGQLAFAQAAAMYFVLITDWGFTLSAPAQLIRAAKAGNSTTQIFNDVISAKLILLAASFALVVIGTLILPTERQNWDLHFAAWLICAGNLLTVGWALQAQERLDLLAISTFVGKITVLPITFLLVHGPEDTWWAALINSLSVVVTGIISLILARKHIAYQWQFSFKGAISQLKLSVDIFLSNAAVSMYTFSSTVILGVLSSPTEVALFSSADKIRATVQSFIGPINQTMYPKAHLAAAESDLAVKAHIRRIFIIQMAISGIMTVFLLAGAPHLITLIYGSQFSEAVPVLRLLAFLPLVIGASNVFGLQGMLPLAMNKLFSRIVVLTAVVSFALLIPLAFHYGAIGAAWAAIICELLVTILMALALYKRLHTINKNR
ncbi:MAG: flippase [Spongiibacteraceae bacterium]